MLEPHQIRESEDRRVAGSRQGAACYCHSAVQRLHLRHFTSSRITWLSSTILLENSTELSTLGSCSRRAPNTFYPDCVD
jgi:hypothetical protein